MDLPNTLMQLRRNQELVAWREGGPHICVAPGGVMMKVFIDKPYRWIPSFEHIIADDWRIGLREERLKKLLVERQAERAE